MGMLDGTTMLVSGVGTGLGRRIALAASREGANVALVARSEDTLRTIAGEIEAASGAAIHQVTDISDEAQCQAAVDATVARFGRLDSLVNCAALDSVFGGVASTSGEDWRRTLEVNVLGSMQMTRAALKPLSVQGGAIVFIGTQTMYMAPAEAPQIAYAASKGALLGATRHLTREVGPLGVRVNTVAPGWMWGPPVQHFVRTTAEAEGVDEEVVLTRLTQHMPLQRMATDAEVAEVVVFFASSRSSGVTGQSVLVNAGEYMQ